MQTVSALIWKIYRNFRRQCKESTEVFEMFCQALWKSVNWDSEMTEAFWQSPNTRSFVKFMKVVLRQITSQQWMRVTKV